ncbi:hypothetical protein SAMN05444396_10794 [Flavobacterium segetis]|uniref:Outer membrane protein assembly factor BamA n=1 Tax=Flavobacterium segetis TaxID=271157 RepID=A0A1M5IJ47_9FLAO|nr:hypothetical protein [Flavobacterium segetis]SHG28322.1 hypothetical protein SAMN05444396_10794 [Flavobacterium segetis]
MSAQDYRLQISGKSTAETKVIDALFYTKRHLDIKSINTEVTNLSFRLSKMGYIDVKINPLQRATDSLFVTALSLGQKIDSISINVSDDQLSFLGMKKKNDVPYSLVDNFLKEIIQKLEFKGYALASIKLINVERINNKLRADLKLEVDKKRILNNITIRYPENNYNSKFPVGHFKQIKKKYNNALFNKKTLATIYDDFEKFSFVNQIKYPEILFTKDTTTVYVYLETKNSNTFDGFLGFSNNENKKITLTGYLDVTLENSIGNGEQISIYWKSDGNNQKTFKASLELPYLFKSPIGFKGEINIFRQDSTFQNTNTAIDLSYYVNYSSRFYLGYLTTQSSDIQNSVDVSISDFNNSFLRTTFEFTKLDNDHTLFPIKTKFHGRFGIGKRKINNSLQDNENTQIAININAIHNFYLNKSNSIYISTQNNYLKSNRYIFNELFRFGGFNSVRGFAENSLQGFLSSTIQTEYRYLIAPSLYVHSIVDYCVFQNKTEFENTRTTEKLLGLGLGIGIQTKNGLLKLAIANGRAKKQEFTLLNAIVHISYQLKF